MSEIRPFEIKQIIKVNFPKTKVAIAGTIVAKENGTSLIDDGTGQITVRGDINQGLGEFIRVFGTVLESSEEKQLQAEVVQDFSKVNKEIYKEVLRKLEKE